MSFTKDNQKTVIVRNKERNSQRYVRHSFIYRNDQKCSPNRKSETDSLPITPFSLILDRISKTREKIANVKSLTANPEDPKNQIIVEILTCSELELEKCIESLLSLPMDKSIREMTSDSFQKILTNELSYIKHMQPNGKQVTQYIAENFTESGDSIPEELMMNISKLSRHKTFRSEIKFSNDIRIYHKEKKLTVIPNIDKWGIDIFTIEEQFPNRVLTVIAYTIFMNFNLDAKLNISPEKMTKFLVQLEEMYHNDVVYHNSTHAADVLQCVNVFLNFPRFEGVFSDCEIFAAILAAAVHDLDHPGFSNHFLIRTDSNLATTYNDISVLENHHVSTAFKLIKKPSLDILSSLKKTEQTYVRKVMIEMVLGTDMSKHYDHVAQMLTISTALETDPKKFFQSSTERIKVLKSMIHCADISTSARPGHIYKKWVERVTNEFFIQGDLERFLGYEPSPMCDRNNIDIQQSQTTFIEYVALPLWESWAQIVYPSADEMLVYMQENKVNLGDVTFNEHKINYDKVIEEYGLKYYTDTTFVNI